MKKLREIWDFIRNIFLADEVILWWITFISFLGVLWNKNDNSSVPAIFFVGAIIVNMLNKLNNGR